MGIWNEESKRSLCHNVWLPELSPTCSVTGIICYLIFLKEKGKETCLIGLCLNFSTICAEDEY